MLNIRGGIIDPDSGRVTWEKQKSEKRKSENEERTVRLWRDLAARTVRHYPARRSLKSNGLQAKVIHGWNHPS
jgi:hypothetical protein